MDASGRLSIALVRSPAPCQALTCISSAGLFAPGGDAAVVGGTVNPGGVGFLVDLVSLNALLGFPLPVAVMPVATFTNESPTIAQNLIRVVTQRETLFNAPQPSGGLFRGAHFRLTVRQKVAAIGPIPILAQTFDYRMVTNQAQIVEKRAGGSFTQVAALAAGASTTFEYDIILQSFAIVDPGSFVESAGLSFSWFSETN